MTGLASVNIQQRANALFLRSGLRLTLFPFAAVVILDGFLRRPMLASLGRGQLLYYGAGALLDILFWASVVNGVASLRSATRRMLGAGAVILAHTVFVGSQIVLWTKYGHCLTPADTVMAARPDMFLREHLTAEWLSLMGLAAIVPAVALLIARRPAKRVRWFRSPWLRVLVVAIGTSVLGWKALWEATTLPPDLLYASSLAMRGILVFRPGPVVTPFERRPASASVEATMGPPGGNRRNVVLVVSESLRYASARPLMDLACPDDDASSCVAFSEMRSLASTTPSSLVQMWTGLPLDADHDQLLEHPTLWDFAHDAGYQVTFTTSHAVFFGNLVEWYASLPFARFDSGYRIDPTASIGLGADDVLTLERTLERVREASGSFVAIAQLANTHMPYVRENPERTIGHEKSFYEAAVQRQAVLVATFLERLRALPQAKQIVVVFVSDHGEQFYEYGHFAGHTLSLHDVEVHVPFWIDAPNGTLTEAERAALNANRDRPATLLDVYSTLLDLTGVLDAARKRSLGGPGRSLLRGESELGPAFMANCNHLWCFRGVAEGQFGALHGKMKVLGKPGAWKCFDLGLDPDEKMPVSGARCDALIGFAERKIATSFHDTLRQEVTPP